MHHLDTGVKVSKSKINFDTTQSLKCVLKEPRIFSAELKAVGKNTQLFCFKS
jgi:hypothetical protein